MERSPDPAAPAGGPDDPLAILEALAGPADDYAPTAPRGERSPARQAMVTAAMSVVALLVGFVVVLGLTTGRDVAVAMDERKAELISLIDERSDHAAALTDQLDSLRVRVAEAEASAAGAPFLAGRIETAEVAAGLVAMQGPGIVVRVDDAGSACRSSRPEDCRIQDRDLQLIANALFDSGAEAVAINGERLIATSAIRRAGRSVLVNYRVLAPPYEVVAIGHRDLLGERFVTSGVAGDFAAWKEAYGLAFEVSASEELRVPGYTGTLRSRIARPEAAPIPDTPGEPGEQPTGGPE